VDDYHEAEFADFVSGVSRRLLHAGDLLTGDRARAEDLVQHGLGVAYARWPAIRVSNPEAYVRRAMLNRYLDWWRRLRWRELPLPDGPEAGPARAPAVDDHAEAVVRRDAVQRALARLTARERAVVVLRFWLDLSEAQIARELRIAPGTVKSTCSRALGKLRASPDLASGPDPTAVATTPRATGPTSRTTPATTATTARTIARDPMTMRGDAR
jgi:RNA polymerase sigma-70 factor (sigma-E family)